VIRKLTIEGFKSFEKVSLTLGNLNLFVGTNASGKSNFFDALRVLQGIGYGLTIDEVFNGKPKSANSEVWEATRGGSAKADFVRRDGEGLPSEERVIAFDISLDLAEEDGGGTVQYAIGISTRSSCVRYETLSHNGEEIYDSRRLDNRLESPVLEVWYHKGGKGRQPHLKFEKSRPVLHQLARHSTCRKAHSNLIDRCTRALGNMQRVDPSPAILREYSQAHSVKRMGERGEHFAALVKTIESDEAARSAYVTWLKQLTPAEPEDVAVLSGALGEALFAVKEHGVTYPAPMLSDGTLRFAAIAAAFFQPDMPDILMIEEIENGIHPSRLRLLVELLRTQATKRRQVMATTHSPVVLAWLHESDYETTFFCNRDDETGGSTIAPLSQVPGFLKIARRQPIGDLFAEEWLEGAL